MSNTESIEKLRSAYEAARSKDRWAQHALSCMYVAGEATDKTSIWYGDGDQCAEVFGNLGLGMDGPAVAEFFSTAAREVPVILGAHKVAIEALEYVVDWVDTWIPDRGAAEEALLERVNQVLSGEAVDVPEAAAAPAPMNPKTVWEQIQSVAPDLMDFAGPDSPEAWIREYQERIKRILFSGEEPEDGSQ